jgi:hypothetical protein
MPDWEQYFPNLGQWQQTSRATDSYNCTAFAASDDQRWWDPIPGDVYYWPDGVPRSYALDSYIALFQTLNYERCQDGSLEPGHEKIVIYTNLHGVFEHVARQLPTGRGLVNWAAPRIFVTKAPPLWRAMSSVIH